MKRRNFITTIGAGMTSSLILPSFFSMAYSANLDPARTWIKPRKNYKCIFNHEMLLACRIVDNPQQYFKSFIERLAGTDVDAVMCCPTMYRTNTFPSEIDTWWKDYKPGQVSDKFPAFDFVRKYIFEGGDPVKDTLEACRRLNIDFFVNYRMNDPHFVDDKTYPTHNAFWREHPEYWMGDSDKLAYGGEDNRRLLNYMIPAVRDYYFSIIEELCTKYDVDGVELDFQRWLRFFHDGEIEMGKPVMTAFMKRIRNMVERIGKERGKTLKVSVRVPQYVSMCEKAGLDITAWDAMGLVDMINLSSCYTHTIELGIEEFRSKTRKAKIFGEMNYIIGFKNLPNWVPNKSGRYHRYTTLEMYRASSLNLFGRGADGISFFNYDYAPRRVVNAEGLKRITDINFLKSVSKNYVIVPNNTYSKNIFPATNERVFDLVIPDNTKKVKFERSVLRLETTESCAGLKIDVMLNGKLLNPIEHSGAELFPSQIPNENWPIRDALKFYEVPLNLIKPGSNHFEIRNLDKEKASCMYYSMEMALYRPSNS